MANGLYTNAELVDTLIVDLNTFLKDVFSGQYINACSTVSQMAQKLVNLRKGITADLESKDKTIETLKGELRNAGRDVVDMSVDEFVKEYGKGGAE